jgi:hypothetical protein
LLPHDYLDSKAAEVIKTPARSYGSLASYAKRIHKVVNPELRIADASAKQMDTIAKSLITRLATEARDLALKEHNGNLHERDFEFACHLILPEDMAKRAIKAGERAIQVFDNYSPP